MASFEKQSDGKTWRYIISYKDDSGKYKKRQKGGFRTKQEAEIHAKAIEEELYNNNFIKFENQTLNDYSRLIEDINKKYLEMDENIKMHLALEILKIDNYKKRTAVYKGDAT